MLAFKVPCKEGQGLGPHVLGRGLVVTRPVIAEKGMACSFINVPLVVDLVCLKGLLYFIPGLLWDALVLFTPNAMHRDLDLVGQGYRLNGALLTPLPSRNLPAIIDSAGRKASTLTGG